MDPALFGAGVRARYLNRLSAWFVLNTQPVAKVAGEEGIMLFAPLKEEPCAYRNAAALLDRSAWVVLLEAQERHCRRTDLRASVIAIGLQGLRSGFRFRSTTADMENMRATASLLQQNVRRDDFVAQTAPTEFKILFMGCDEVGGLAVLDRLQRVAAAAKLTPSFGLSTRTPETGLYVTSHRASEARESSR